MLLMKKEQPTEIEVDPMKTISIHNTSKLANFLGTSCSGDPDICINYGECGDCSTCEADGRNHLATAKCCERHGEGWRGLVGQVVFSALYRFHKIKALLRSTTGQSIAGEERR